MYNGVLLRGRCFGTGKCFVETGKPSHVTEMRKVEQQLYLMLRKTVRKVEIVEAAVYHEGSRGSSHER